MLYIASTAEPLSPSPVQHDRTVFSSKKDMHRCAHFVEGKLRSQGILELRRQKVSLLILRSALMRVLQTCIGVPPVREMLEQVLQDGRFCVLEVQDATSCFQAAKARRRFIIVVNYTMPILISPRGVLDRIPLDFWRQEGRFCAN